MTEAPARSAAALGEVVRDLAIEEERLELVLASLDDEAWASASGAPGWSVADVVLHLAQTEALVVGTLEAGGAGSLARAPGTLDAVVDSMVRASESSADEVFEQWRRSRREALVALAEADPAKAVTWAATPLRPATLATTRLAEHWAHALDVTGPLGIPYEDSDRLRHVARLGYRTLPYAWALAAEEPQPVHCRLEAPGGGVWELGDPACPSSITGAAGEFCRVGARRLSPEQTSLRAHGPHARRALEILRNYAV